MSSQHGCDVIENLSVIITTRDEIKETEDERKGRKEEVEAGRRIMGKEKQVVEVTLQEHN